jgi:hypothetical protein
MTKLEKLKAARDAAYDKACDKQGAGVFNQDGLKGYWSLFDNADTAYLTELKKQEENE